MRGSDSYQHVPEIPGRGSGRVHVRLKALTRAGGARPFTVRVDSVERHAVRPGLVSEERIECSRRLSSRSLDLEVAHDEHAEVARVVVPDVCALQVDRPAKPDTTLRVNDQVVADIRPAAVLDVRDADHLESLGGFLLRAYHGRGHPVVMHGDVLNADHRVGVRNVGLCPCPLVPCVNRKTRLCRQGRPRSVAVGNWRGRFSDTLVGPDGSRQDGAGVAS